MHITASPQLPIHARIQKMFSGLQGVRGDNLSAGGGGRGSKPVFENCTDLIRFNFTGIRMGDQNLRGGEKGLHGMHELTEFSQRKKVIIKE